MTTKKQKPKITTPALYRAQLTCRIGTDLFTGVGKPPSGVDRGEYALYLMFRAIEDIALALDEKGAEGSENIPTA